MVCVVDFITLKTRMSSVEPANMKSIASIYEVAGRSVFLIHETIRNSTKSLIKNIEKYGNSDEGLLQYAQFWYNHLHSHHSHEDKLVFPLMERYNNDCANFKHDHTVLNELLVKIQASISKKNLDKNDIVKVDQLLQPHLQLEEEQWGHLDGNVPETELKNMLKLIQEESQKESPPQEGLMFILYHLDAEEKDEFIYNEAGVFLKYVLVPWVFDRRHGAMFKKYATYDSY